MPYQSENPKLYFNYVELSPFLYLILLRHKALILLSRFFVLRTRFLFSYVYKSLNWGFYSTSHVFLYPIVTDYMFVKYKIDIQLGLDNRISL